MSICNRLLDWYEGKVSFVKRTRRVIWVLDDLFTDRHWTSKVATCLLHEVIVGRKVTDLICNWYQFPILGSTGLTDRQAFIVLVSGDENSHHKNDQA